jgi:hypothetical protein
MGMGTYHGHPPRASYSFCRKRTEAMSAAVLGPGEPGAECGAQQQASLLKDVAVHRSACEPTAHIAACRSAGERRSHRPTAGAVPPRWRPALLQLSVGLLREVAARIDLQKRTKLRRRESAWLRSIPLHSDGVWAGPGREMHGFPANFEHSFLAKVNCVVVNLGTVTLQGVNLER